MLTSDEIEFIRHHGITGELLLVHHLPGAFWKAEAKSRGINFVVGNECSKGHRLKSRTGHCIQCNPARIAYQLRNTQPGHIYVAWSEYLGLSKVGVTRDVDGREISLRNNRYGGAEDWRIVFSQYIDSAGGVERKVLTRLRQVREIREYEKESRLQQAFELFDATAEEVEETVKQVLSNSA